MLKQDALPTPGTPRSLGAGTRPPSPRMDELKALRAEQKRSERAIFAQAQLQLEQLRADAARRRAQLRAALRAQAHIEVLS